MKIALVNVLCGSGSTGKICTAIGDYLIQAGHECRIFYTCGTDDSGYGQKYASDAYIKAQALCAKVFGNYGFNAKHSTLALISQLEQMQPDIVHLHNLHTHNCNLELLFRYLQRKQIKVVWTFHDCWAFTGYCTHFDAVCCDTWKNGCSNCPQRKKYSCFFDRSRYLYEMKRKLFLSMPFKIVTPSQWLAEQVQESFLSGLSTEVINNGIDLRIFRPTESAFRQKYQIEDKFVILGVAYAWENRKGLDVFIRLAKRLDDSFQIVLVGTDSKVDKKLPEGIISIHRTQNQKELAQIYAAADLFVNPTREETLGMVNIEALACGTPVLTFRTGGSAEIIDETCGVSVEKNDEEALYQEILRIKRERPYDQNACLQRAEAFQAEACYRKYIDLYENLVN